MPDSGRFTIIAAVIVLLRTDSVIIRSALIINFATESKNCAQVIDIIRKPNEEAPLPQTDLQRRSEQGIWGYVPPPIIWQVSVNSECSQ